MSELLPAENDGFLPIDPDPDSAAIFVIVVVAGCSNASPYESAVGQDWTQSCKEAGT